MTIARKFIALAAPIALLGLSACSTGFKADVARYQAMPAPTGQSFVIQTSNPKLQGGLEFSQYASLVSEELRKRGYAAAETPQAATLVVNVDYGVDDGQTKVVSRPGLGWGGPFYYGPRYSRWAWGWHDPFWYSGFDYPEVSSYTVFTSKLELTINRTSDGERVFEGKARARSSQDSLPKLIPNLVTAMFTGFPGNSGEEVKITVMPEGKK